MIHKTRELSVEQDVREKEEEHITQKERGGERKSVRR
jgi:hypothetical protein